MEAEKRADNSPSVLRGRSSCNRSVTCNARSSTSRSSRTNPPESVSDKLLRIFCRASVIDTAMLRARSSTKNVSRAAFPCRILAPSSPQFCNRDMPSVGLPKPRYT